MSDTTKTPDDELRQASGYWPWTPPFRYNACGQWIEDSKGQRLLDMRGWGYLTGNGSEALGMEENAAAEIQDRIGRGVTDMMNGGHNAKLSDQRKETNPTP
jgi:hypothetical protein